MAKPLMRVVNTKGVLGMFDLVKRRTPEAVERGLKLGGLLVQSDSMKQTPVDTGDLRRSHHVSHTGSGLTTRVKVYLTQSYAIYVHEDPEAKHAAGTNYKFLSRALQSNVHKIRLLIISSKNKR